MHAVPSRAGAPPGLRILWVDEPRGVGEQMRRDAALLRAVREADRPVGVLRLYGFAPAGITLGRSQEPAHELDLERCRAEGVAWAVRPTGGRAIWHDEDWTFACAGTIASGFLAGTPREAYRRTAELFAGALGSLGVDTDLTPGSTHGPGAVRGTSGAAPPCFASSARHELTRDGRKLAGIAQREAGAARLQQGSLLVGESHLRIVEFLRLEPTSREAARFELEDASTWLVRREGKPDFGDFVRATAAQWRPDATWPSDPGTSDWHAAGLPTSAYPLRADAVDRPDP